MDILQNEKRRICIILRGLPKSGKSDLGKSLQAAAARKGFVSPLLHSLDDYFLVEQRVGSRGKAKGVSKWVYKFDPTMLEAYRRAAQRAFAKAVEQQRTTFVIVDQVNALVDHFRHYWSVAQNAGFIVFVSELKISPEESARRSAHPLSRLQRMKASWEVVPIQMQVLAPELLRRAVARARQAQDTALGIKDKPPQGVRPAATLADGAVDRGGLGTGVLPMDRPYQQLDLAKSIQALPPATSGRGQVQVLAMAGLQPLKQAKFAAQAPQVRMAPTPSDGTSALRPGDTAGQQAHQTIPPIVAVTSRELSQSWREETVFRSALSQGQGSGVDGGAPSRWQSSAALSAGGSAPTLGSSTAMPWPVASGGPRLGWAHGILPSLAGSMGSRGASYPLVSEQQSGRTTGIPGYLPVAPGQTHLVASRWSSVASYGTHASSMQMQLAIGDSGDMHSTAPGARATGSNGIAARQPHLESSRGSAQQQVFLYPTVSRGHGATVWEQAEMQQNESSTAGVRGPLDRSLPNVLASESASSVHCRLMLQQQYLRNANVSGPLSVRSDAAVASASDTESVGNILDISQQGRRQQAARVAKFESAGSGASSPAAAGLQKTGDGSRDVRSTLLAPAGLHHSVASMKDGLVHEEHTVAQRKGMLGQVQRDDSHQWQHGHGFVKAVACARTSQHPRHEDKTDGAVASSSDSDIVHEAADTDSGGNSSGETSVTALRLLSGVKIDSSTQPGGAQAIASREVVTESRAVRSVTDGVISAGKGYVYPLGSHGTVGIPVDPEVVMLSRLTFPRIPVPYAQPEAGRSFSLGRPSGSAPSVQAPQAPMYTTSPAVQGSKSATKAASLQHIDSIPPSVAAAEQNPRTPGLIARRLRRLRDVNMRIHNPGWARYLQDGSDGYAASLLRNRRKRYRSDVDATAPHTPIVPNLMALGETGSEAPASDGTIPGQAASLMHIAAASRIRLQPRECDESRSEISRAVVESDPSSRPSSRASSHGSSSSQHGSRGSHTSNPRHARAARVRNDHMLSGWPGRPTRGNSARIGFGEAMLYTHGDEDSSDDDRVVRATAGSHTWATASRSLGISAGMPPGIPPQLKGAAPQIDSIPPIAPVSTAVVQARAQSTITRHGSPRAGPTAVRKAQSTQGLDEPPVSSSSSASSTGSNSGADMDFPLASKDNFEADRVATGGSGYATAPSYASSVMSDGSGKEQASDSSHPDERRSLGRRRRAQTTLEAPRQRRDSRSDHSAVPTQRQQTPFPRSRPSSPHPHGVVAPADAGSPSRGFDPQARLQVITRADSSDDGDVESASDSERSLSDGSSRRRARQVQTAEGDSGSDADAESMARRSESGDIRDLTSGGSVAVRAPSRAGSRTSIGSSAGSSVASSSDSGDSSGGDTTKGRRRRRAVDRRRGLIVTAAIAADSLTVMPLDTPDKMARGRSPSPPQPRDQLARSRSNSSGALADAESTDAHVRDSGHELEYESASSAVSANSSKAMVGRRPRHHARRRTEGPTKSDRGDLVGPRTGDRTRVQSAKASRSGRQNAAKSERSEERGSTSSGVQHSDSRGQASLAATVGSATGSIGSETSQSESSGRGDRAAARGRSMPQGAAAASGSSHGWATSDDPATDDSTSGTSVLSSRGYRRSTRGANLSGRRGTRRMSSAWRRHAVPFHAFVRRIPRHRVDLKLRGILLNRRKSDLTAALSNSTSASCSDGATDEAALSGIAPRAKERSRTRLSSQDGKESVVVAAGLHVDVGGSGSRDKLEAGKAPLQVQGSRTSSQRVLKARHVQWVDRVIMRGRASSHTSDNDDDVPASATMKSPVHRVGRRTGAPTDGAVIPKPDARETVEFRATTQTRLAVVVGLSAAAAIAEKLDMSGDVGRRRGLGGHVAQFGMRGRHRRRPRGQARGLSERPAAVRRSSRLNLGMDVHPNALQHFGHGGSRPRTRLVLGKDRRRSQEKVARARQKIDAGEALVALGAIATDGIGSGSELEAARVRDLERRQRPPAVQGSSALEGLRIPPGSASATNHRDMQAFSVNSAGGSQPLWSAGASTRTGPEERGDSGSSTPHSRGVPQSVHIGALAESSVEESFDQPLLHMQPSSKSHGSIPDVMSSSAMGASYSIAGASSGTITIGLPSHDSVSAASAHLLANVGTPHASLGVGVPPASGYGVGGPVAVAGPWAPLASHAMSLPGMQPARLPVTRGEAQVIAARLVVQPSPVNNSQLIQTEVGRNLGPGWKLGQGGRSHRLGGIQPGPVSQQLKGQPQGAPRAVRLGSSVAIASSSGVPDAVAAEMLHHGGGQSAGWRKGGGPQAGIGSKRKRVSASGEQAGVTRSKGARAPSAVASSRCAVAAGPPADASTRIKGARAPSAVAGSRCVVAAGPPADASSEGAGGRSGRLRAAPPRRSKRLRAARVAGTRN